MTTIEIKHRHTCAVLYSTEVDDGDQYPVRTAVVRAVRAGANLIRADLSYANLGGADLGGANLSSANLIRADLSYANLGYSQALDPIRDDVRSVLDAAPAEVAGLLSALDAGKVNGTVYTGACACLVGTIANLRGCAVAALTGTLAPNSDRQAERWFLGIALGATPDNNPVAAITRDWICEWLSERGEGELITEVAS